jgi:ATP-dependent exoDNAse (exonuclease V) beta subunit
VVILTALDEGLKGKLFQCRVISAPEFDPKDPLANRSITFLPWPFGAKKKFDELETILGDMKENAKEQEMAEQRRLLYVALTRAKEKMIFTDTFSVDPASPLLYWPKESGKQKVKAGDKEFDITVKDIEVDTAISSKADEEPQYLLPQVEKTIPLPPAKFTASSLHADKSISAVVNDVADFKTGITVLRKPEPTAFGNAIHGFFAADAGQLSQEKQLAMVDRLLKRWNVKGSTAPEDVIKANERFDSWLESSYPGAHYFREWPVTLYKNNYQRMEGWIDVLLELPEGYVIIDHKTTSDTKREDAKGYAPQLFAYKEAVEAATSKKVLATLVHLPVLGLVVALKKNTEEP